MTKRIFRSILAVALVVLTACLCLVIGVLYVCFGGVEGGWNTAIAGVLDVLPFLLLTFGAVLLLCLWLASRLAKKTVEPLNKLNLDDPFGSAVYEELSPLMRRIDSQQKRMKEQAASLRRKQEEFSAVTENMREGLVLLGSDHTILSMNSSAAKLLGTDADCVSRDVLTVSRKPELQRLLETAQTGIQGKAVLPIDGRDYRVVANPVYSEGAISGAVLLFLDVTEREQAEAMRQEFTANVSHELKTPLHTISGYAELMSTGVAKEEDMPRFSGLIYSEARRMIDLVEDILNLSQLDEGAEGFAWERTDLYALAKETVERLQPIGAQAQVSVLLAGNPAPMEGIPQLIRGIIHNLCDNGIKYNRAGGRVEVHINATELEAVLTVVDTGIGIPKEHRERIFERFYRVDKSRSKEVGGTGLGLSIVKHAAKVHNARILLQSTPNAGTTVTVRFPRKRQ